MWSTTPSLRAATVALSSWPFACIYPLVSMASDDGDSSQETITLPAETTTIPPQHRGLEEIVVTAQKRSESLQDTPISIQAFGADLLAQRGIDSLDDLLSNVPNLTIETFPTHNATLRIYIRGVGVHDAQLTQDPAVGIYIDGVYVARSVGLALDVADLERIEVLRGPQGTLYGRNTTGGTINLITRRPHADSFSMQHRLGLSDRKGVLARSSINLPLGDRLAVKFAALGSRRDGYVENTGPGHDFGDRAETALRFDLRWGRPGELLADYGFEWSDMDYTNQLFQATALPETDKGTGEFIKPAAVARTTYSTRRLDALATGAPMEESGSRIEGHTLTLALPFGQQELKYIAGYRSLLDREYADLGGGAGSTEFRLDSHVYDGPAADAANGGPTPLVIPTVTQSQWSHELQLSGDVWNGGLRYVAGLYYFRETGVEDRHRLNHQFSAGLAPEQINQFGLSDVLATTNNARLVQFVDFWWSIENTALAAFGQATWTPRVLDSRLHLTLGYRHSEDERAAVKFRITDTYLELLEPGGQGTASLFSSAEMFDYVPASRKFSDDSVSTIVAFDLSESVNLYAKSVEAYKSGGFNVRDPHISGDSAGAEDYGFGFVDGFDSEQVQSYELGLKSEWLDRRLRINADVFSTEYRDMQINFLLPATIADTKTRNAGKARMRGLEIDTTWLIAPNLTLLADYAYLDAKVQEVIDEVSGENVARFYPFPSAPPQSWVAAIDWQFLQRDWGQLRAYLSYNYTGERIGVVITEERRGLNTIPAYGLINTRLTLSGLRLAGGELELALWGRNLSDKVYPIMAIDNTPQTDRGVVWGEPLNVGLDMVYRFN